MRHLEHDHGAHGGQRPREELGPVDDEGRFQQVRGAQVDVQPARARQVAHQRGQDGDVRVQLDLARHVDYDEVFFRHAVEGLGEEVDVFEEESVACAGWLAPREGWTGGREEGGKGRRCRGCGRMTYSKQ